MIEREKQSIECALDIAKMLMNSNSYHMDARVEAGRHYAEILKIKYGLGGNDE